MLWNLANLGPSQYTTFIATINADNNQETAGFVANKLRNFESMINDPVQAHVSAMVKKLKEEFKEEMREIREKLETMICPRAFGRRCLVRLEVDLWDSGAKVTEGPKPTTLSQKKEILAVYEFTLPQRYSNFTTIRRTLLTKILVRTRKCTL
ncbi:hypothetical protein TURU_012421 [Turdus rufiventris]|nr:hypothetical protein TURU_012421 [Turdus rufiventris]